MFFMNILSNSKCIDQNANLRTPYETSVNCDMFSMNIHQNPTPIDQNAHLQTLYETLLQTYAYSNLTFGEWPI